MSDPSFEHQLGRLFAEPPSLTGHVEFTAAVQARLERGWAMRRILIGAAGVVGGLVAAGLLVWWLFPVFQAWVAHQDCVALARTNSG